jgi:hypothetical protein
MEARRLSLDSQHSQHKDNATSVKVIHNKLCKRINNAPNKLSEMKENIKKLYELSEEKIDKMKIYVSLTETDFSLIDEKLYIDTESDYLKILDDSKNSCKVFKIFLEFTDEIEIEKENENINKTIMTSIIQNQNSQLINNLNNSNFFLKKTRFSSKCDICQTCPIEDLQFICLVCDDLFLCQKCENLHCHPVIKLKSNEFQTKEDICNLILDNKSIKRNTFKNIILSKQSLLNKLRETFQPITKFHVRIEMDLNYFVIKPNSSFRIHFSIINDGAVSLPQDTYVYLKNNEDILFSSVKVGKLFSPGERIEMFLECLTTSRDKEYNIELHPYQRDTKIEYAPFRFKIKVTENLNDEFQENSKDHHKDFNPEDTVSTLPNEKKIVLSEIIKNNYSTKDVLEICKILDKHNWKLSEEALKEMK